MSDAVLYECPGPTARLTLNRPEKLNAINAEMVRAIRASLARARGEDDVEIVSSRGPTRPLGRLRPERGGRLPLAWRDARYS